MVEDLHVRFDTEEGVARAVDGVSFCVGRDETFCLVGESGCGKTVTALSILRLAPSPPGRIVRGRIIFDGRDMLALPNRAMRRLRGESISMIFQEPMTSLDPVFTVGDQIAEALRQHRKLSRREASSVVLDMLVRVGIPDPERRIGEYPHQLSGGMQQRVMIAMALACRPRLLIADEPTTALDVTIQAQILDLLRQLQEELHMAILLITHDLGVVAQMADRVAVMYAGRIVESAAVNDIFRSPQHPYTASLLKSLPGASEPGERLRAIRGFVPDARAYPSGCRFHPRCDVALPQCARIEPALREVTPGQWAACILLSEGGAHE
ncbi:MAG: ABC transporter ATP-binding protein [Planctomycetes bacterium]|nr:ABC transporter ATP-binding protein [Planctomycetota bacterium]